jgi:hypothetical protein
VTLEGFFDRDSFPRSPQVNLSAAKDNPFSQANGTGYGLNQCLALLHEGPVIATGSIPLKKGKFGNVLTPPLSASPAAADLKDLLVPCGKHALHAKLRRGVEEPRAGRDRFDVGFGCRRGNTVRGLYFQISLIDKKLSNAMNNERSLMKSLSAPGECFQSV